MGYYTRITGEITIEPPLTYAEVKQWRAQFKDGDDKNCDLRLKVEKEPIETDQGVLTRTRGVAFVPYDDSFKAYRFMERLHQAVEMFATEGRTFTGRFEAEGESAGDLWRAKVRKGRVVTTTAWIVWPEDLNELRKAWQETLPLGDEAEDASRLVTLRTAVTNLLDHAHREASKEV